MLIDTHTHLNFKAFEKDWPEVVERAKKAGVGKMMVVGTDLESSGRAAEMAEKTEGLYATVGIHPVHCQSVVSITRGAARLKKLGKSKKVVGIGECGLDYFRGSEDKDLQKRAFGMQIQLAKELGLPMVIHNRKAGEEVLDSLDHFCKSDGKYPKGVFHCISGSKKYLDRGLEMGFYVGVDGNVTYSKEVQRLAKLVPLDRLVLETDAPFLLPEPFRSQGDRLRNQPAHVTIVAEFLAKIKSVSLEKIKASTSKNAEALFNI